MHVALILLGLEPKGGLKFQGDPAPPEGDPVESWVQWQEPDGLKKVRIEQLVYNARDKRAMEFTNWIFTGSVMYKDRYLAAVEKSLIATYHDPIAIINNPLPGGADDTVYEVNAEVVPQVGTPITMIIKAVGKETEE